MSDQITAVQYGCGPIGGRIVDVATDRGIEFVGAIDVDPDKVGADLGAVAGLDEELGVVVTDEPEVALATDPDVVFHSTASSLDVVRPQLEDALAAGADVVSTTEELSYPWRTNPRAARAIDEVGKRHGTTCLGTGINPGFVMDTLPAVLTTPARSVESIRVERVQDAATRRKPLQEKIGAGKTVEAFEEAVVSKAGHVGLTESIGLLAHAIGWEIADVAEQIEPVIADEPFESDHFTVDEGAVLGIRQTARAYTADGDEVIELDLAMYLGAPDPADRVTIRGTPDVECVIEGGLHGDLTTPAVVVNVVPQVREGLPGLLTMTEIRTPSYSIP